MPTMRTRLVLIVLAVSLVAASAIAQTRRLLAGGSRSHFGLTELSGAFDPDPHVIEVRSGGNLDVRSMGLGRECVGFATDRPDVIVRYAEPAEHLAFQVRANGGDTTLVVHTPDGHWRCDDDGAGGTNPRVDIESPAAGQYDVWVGSYRPDQFLRADLRVTGQLLSARRGARSP